MRRKIVLSSILLATMLIIGKISYAAVEIIPSKTNGKDQIVNTTVSNSYLLCKGMKDTGGSLKGTGVDVHLATNKDWGAVSYLSNSIYGTNTQGGNTGTSVSINGISYYSTTTNITGVMNWGSNPNITRYTQTAGLVSSYTSGTNTSVTELYNNRETKYVDYIDPLSSADTKGMAIQETSGKYGSNFSANRINSYPCSIRIGLFGGNCGANYGGAWRTKYRRRK